MTKCKRSGKNKTENIKRLKAKIQREQRSAYWKYIESMIIGIPVSESDQPFFTQFQKKTILLYQGPENSSFPTLREDGLLRNDTHSKSNILNRQFHKEFTPVTDTPIPNKGSCNILKIQIFCMTFSMEFVHLVPVKHN